MRKWREGDVPCMAVNPDLGGPGCGLAASDNREAAAAAVMHLHGLGHRRIATITGALETRPAAERLAGYRDAIEQLGLDPREDFIVGGDFYAQSGYEAALRLLALDEPPTAIFAASDMMAAGVFQAAHERGVRVPEALAVVGFDDIAFAALLQPPLT